MSWLLSLLLGCAPGPSPAAAEPPRTLTVLAASSLTPVMGQLERDFEAANPGVDVLLSFAGSQTLATQVRHGIEADVFASADQAQLAALEAEGLAQERRSFATNRLVIAQPAWAEPTSLAQLGQVERLVLGVPEVPLGAYSLQLLDAAEARYGVAWRAQVDARVVSREANARLVSAKVNLGEADAAIVYATDLAATKHVFAVELPDGLGPVARYHQATLREAPQPQLAAAWRSFVEGPAGQEILVAWGFGAAP